MLENAIREFFRDKKHIISVDLFGSYVQGRETERSDVDIAVLCDYGHLPSLFEILEWRDELENILHKKVDLHHLSWACK